MFMSAYPNSRDLPTVRDQAVTRLGKPFVIDAPLQYIEEAIEQATTGDTYQ
jgi:hypothetical protein